MPLLPAAPSTAMIPRPPRHFRPSTLLHASGPTSSLLFPPRPSLPCLLCRPRAINVLRPRCLGSVSATAAPDTADVDEAAEQPSLTEQFDWYAQWYPLFPLCDLDKRVPHAVTVLGLNLVVWWDCTQECWQVFDDRCPHRLAPLSEGRIDQWGRLQCVYHGWCFDGKGSCKLIPQAPVDGPPEKKIAENGQANWQKACFVPTKSDGLVVGFRKWLKKYSNYQVDWRNKFKTNLPPSPPREQLMDRYRSHVLQCRSCSVAVRRLNALEVSLQVISIVLIAFAAAVKQNAMSTPARNTVAFAAILCFIGSRWLSYFIYKTFHYHDYNHALIFK